ncbi:MAG: sensor histidine kinase N-terminal domain-containing protein [Pelomonas sp.]|nr:sensor histidine kinase N-terminal domain-containing protein [Roseateles sp.]
MKRPASLQARLLAGMAAVTLVVGVLTTVLAVRQARHELDELLDAHLTQAAALLVVQHSARLPHDDDAVLDAPSLHRYAPRAVFQVFHEGRLALRSSQAPPTPLVPLVPGGEPGFHTVQRGNAQWRVFVTDGAAADVTVLVGERVSARLEILAAMLGPLLGLGAAASALMLGLAVAVLRWGLSPLRRLRETLAGRQPGQLAALPAGEMPAELAPLVDTLNLLFQRLDALLQGERRLTADAAHELRTPIAAIRAQAQVALGAQADDERRRALQATLAGCDRAARVVEQLLMLARLEAGDAPPRRPLALADLARQAVAEAAEHPLLAGHVLALEVASPAIAAGDALLTQLLLRNLLDNAVRYSPAGSPVTVTVDAAGPQGWQLTVEDGGPGLDAAGLARLGQRFQRGEGVTPSGSGLGWSIVHRIAALQGWRVQADRSPALGGLRVRLTAE